MHVRVRLQCLAARFFLTQLMKGRTVLLYPACNPIHTHTHSHTFTCNLAEELWCYLFYFKHVDSESFDLAFRDADAAAVTALLAFVGIQAS